MKIEMILVSKDGWRNNIPLLGGFLTYQNVEKPKIKGTGWRHVVGNTTGEPYKDQFCKGS